MPETPRPMPVELAVQRIADNKTGHVVILKAHAPCACHSCVETNLLVLCFLVRGISIWLHHPQQP